MTTKLSKKKKQEDSLLFIEDDKNLEKQLPKMASPDRRESLYAEI
jgi:hypothetical protein